MINPLADSGGCSVLNGLDGQQPGIGPHVPHRLGGLSIGGTLLCGPCSACKKKLKGKKEPWKLETRKP